MTAHTLQMIRPLSAPLVRLRTDVGPRYFLVDSGWPF